MKDETEFPSSKANKEEWEKLKEPSPWLEHVDVKLSPLVFGCGSVMGLDMDITSKSIISKRKRKLYSNVS